MKFRFVPTTNARAFMAAYDALERRGATEASLMVVEGEPGLGKTSTLSWWAIDNDAIYLRAKREWTPAWMMKELLAELRIAPEHGFEKNFGQAVRALTGRMDHARQTACPFAIIIDEVDYVARNSKVLETLRDLSDLIEVPVILVGMARIKSALVRFPQVASRVAQYVSFVPLAAADTAALVAGRCECEVDPALVDLLHAHAKGRAREVLEGIASIERHGARLGRPVTIADMAGQALLNDRATGRPIVVRAA